MQLATAAAATPRPQLAAAYTKLADVFVALGGGYEAMTPTDVRPAASYVATARTQAYDAVSQLKVAARGEPSGSFAHRMIDIASRSAASGADNLPTLQQLASQNNVDGYMRLGDAVWKQFEVAFDAVEQVLETE